MRGKWLKVPKIFCKKKIWKLIYDRILTRYEQIIHKIKTIHHSVYVPHLPYLSIDECLDCFHVLVIVNSGAIDVGHRCLFELWFSQHIFLVVGLLSKSEREKQTLCINIYMWNPGKWFWWTYLQARNKGIDVENGGLVDIEREGERGTNGESGTDLCTLPRVK